MQQTRRGLKKVQMRGGAREPHARRSGSTLSVRPRAPTKQMGLFQHLSLAAVEALAAVEDLVAELLEPQRGLVRAAGGRRPHAGLDDLAHEDRVVALLHR